MGPQVSIRCAVTIATCLSSPGSGCWEVWATEGEVQWPGIKGYGSVLGLSSLVGWGMGPVPQNSQPSGGQWAEMSDTGRRGIGGPPEASPTELEQWVSPGLEARVVGLNTTSTPAT